MEINGIRMNQPATRWLSASKLVPLFIKLAAYSVNLAAFAYIHWANRGNAGDFTWGSEALIEAGKILLLSYSLVILYWVTFVDLSSKLPPGMDPKKMALERIQGTFLFVRWLSTAYYMAKRATARATMAMPPTNLRESIVYLIDRNCRIADVILLIVIPFFVGHPGLFSSLSHFPELEVGLPREGTVYFVLLLWFNALAQEALWIYCKLTLVRSEGG